MNLLKTIFTGILITAFSTTNAVAFNNCNDLKYRQNHPSQCKNTDYSNTLLKWGGAAALAGLGSALAINASASHSSHTNTLPQATSLSPNINTNYALSDTITNPRISTVSYLDSLTHGSDIDSSVINSIRNSANYIRNTQQLDGINFAWASARGFTGKNVTINILDNFSTYHGNTVRDIVTYIAQNAHINTYNISSNGSSFSYDSITNALNSGQPAMIYNASWQVPSTQTFNAATVIYNNDNSLKTYAQAQDYLYNATNQNFVTSLRNTANNNDAIFVISAGNESQPESGILSAMPIAFPDLNGHFVNVIATNNNNQIAWYSNQCGITQNYCIAAPGTAWNTDSAEYASGTSFAAPTVSAAIATIKEAFPYMTATQITELLFTTATDLGDPGVDSVYGWGLLDMEKATKPVGTPKIVLANGNVQSLNNTSVSGVAAGAIKNTGVKLAFIDDFGRAFTTKLSNKIHVIPYGRGFDRLRESDENSTTLFDGFEFGFKQNDLLRSSGLISTKSNDIINFIGYKNEIDISGLQFYQQIRTGFSNPIPEENSIVTNFSTIYTQTIKTGIKWNDLAVEFAIPDQIIAGNMSLYVPVARTNNGAIVYDNADVDLKTKPSTEYTVKYKNLSATYVNNPDWQDEFFIMTKFKKTF